MNLANNHALDYGAEAQLETIRALRAAHLDYDGPAGPDRGASTPAASRSR